ncbi:hypothetical protein F5B21DRAFT_472761 [Xylaria acuta]|nr:hypothetical protein F5B21DRAFT_472761 [Xylaria acuta]
MYSMPTCVVILVLVSSHHLVLLVDRSSTLRLEFILVEIIPARHEFLVQSVTKLADYDPLLFRAFSHQPQV